jgi:hypothetical protein
MERVVNGWWIDLLIHLRSDGAVARGGENIDIKDYSGSKHGSRPRGNDPGGAVTSTSGWQRAVRRCSSIEVRARQI